MSIYMDDNYDDSPMPEFGNDFVTLTLTEVEKKHKYIWWCDTGYENGNRIIDVLVYNNQEDLDNDTDNSLAVDRFYAILDVNKRPDDEALKRFKQKTTIIELIDKFPEL